MSRSVFQLWAKLLSWCFYLNRIFIFWLKTPVFPKQNILHTSFKKLFFMLLLFSGGGGKAPAANIYSLVECLKISRSLRKDKKASNLSWSNKPCLLSGASFMAIVWDCFCLRPRRGGRRLAFKHEWYGFATRQCLFLFISNGPSFNLLVQT